MNKRTLDLVEMIIASGIYSMMQALGILLFILFLLGLRISDCNINILLLVGFLISDVIWVVLLCKNC